MDNKNKCFSSECINEVEVEFCPECLENGGSRLWQLNPQIENNFMYHAPKNGQPVFYEAIRKKRKSLHI